MRQFFVVYFRGQKFSIPQNEIRSAASEARTIYTNLSGEVYNQIAREQTAVIPRRPISWRAIIANIHLQATAVVVSSVFLFVSIFSSQPESITGTMCDLFALAILISAAIAIGSRVLSKPVVPVSEIVTFPVQRKK